MKIPKLFKKAAAFVMAAVTALSIMPATAFAAGDIGTISFSHTYDSKGNAMRYNSSANIGDYTAGGTGNYKYRMFVDGENAFCIQPGVPLKTGNTLKKASSDTWNALSANQKKAVGLALLYGYQGNRNNLSGKPVCVSAGKNTHSKRDSRDIWVNKLRCSCGSSYRKNKWHTKLDGKTSYGYQCYNQLNNGIKRKRAEIGLDTEGYCDSRMITDWKLDFMAKALLEHLWTERKESVLIALDLIKYYYKEEKSNETQSDTVTIQAKLDKANSRLTNLIAMRADGEISKDEYQAMRSPVDEEIKKLQKALDEIPQEKSNPKGLDIEGIRSTLNSFIDFSGSTISHDVVNQFVYLITPTSDTTFDWYVNLNGTADVKATFTAEGRKKNCIIKLEEIEKISSVHREKNEDNAHFIKNPHIFTYLHRLQSLRRMQNKHIAYSKK